MEVFEKIYKTNGGDYRKSSACWGELSKLKREMFIGVFRHVDLKNLMDIAPFNLVLVQLV
jgi:hypothetical protein